jgi:hypothetical protein
MSMITIVRNEKLVKVTGDFFMDGSPDWRRTKKMNDLRKALCSYEKTLKGVKDTHTPIGMSNFSYDTMEALRELKIDPSLFIQSKYRCPFNKMTHYSLIPVVYMAKTATLETTMFSGKEPLLPDYMKNTLMDTEYVYESHFDADLDLSRIQGVLMGAGYTDGTYPNDGSVCFRNFAMLLDNGDYLLVKIIEWCNK